MIARLILVLGIIVTLVGVLTSVGMLMWSSHLEETYQAGQQAVAQVLEKPPERGVHMLTLKIKSTDINAPIRVVKSHAVSPALYKRVQPGQVLKVRWRGDWTTMQPLLVADRPWVGRRVYHLLMGALVAIGFGISLMVISVLKARSTR